MSYVEDRLREISKSRKAHKEPKKITPPRRTRRTFDGIHKVTAELSTGERRTYIYAWRGGPRVYGETPSELKEAFDKIVKARASKAERKRNAPKPRTVEAACRVISNNIRARSIKAGMQFYLPWQEIFRMGEEQEWKCAISGLPFDREYQKEERAAYNPFGISVDRIDNSKGYERKNVRLVLTAVNFALNTWGDDIFIKIATAVASKQSGVKCGL